MTLRNRIDRVARAIETAPAAHSSDEMTLDEFRALSLDERVRVLRAPGAVASAPRKSAKELAEDEARLDRFRRMPVEARKELLAAIIAAPESRQRQLEDDAFARYGV
jgi:hypothetical protein